MRLKFLKKKRLRNLNIHHDSRRKKRPSQALNDFAQNVISMGTALPKKIKNRKYMNASEKINFESESFVFEVISNTQKAGIAEAQREGIAEAQHVFVSEKEAAANNKQKIQNGFARIAVHSVQILGDWFQWVGRASIVRSVGPESRSLHRHEFESVEYRRGGFGNAF